MASAGRGWQSGLRALTCAGLLLTPSAGHAQSEVRKTPPRPPAQVEVNKGVQNPVAVTPAAEPAAPAWSAEVSERGVAAIAAEIGGDEARTRFSIVLSGTAPYQYFLLADPYRIIVDIPDVSFRLPKGAGQQGRGLIEAYRYGLFAPGKSRIVIDTKGPVRVEANVIARRLGSAITRINLEILDRPGELSGQASAARAAAKGD